MVTVGALARAVAASLLSDRAPAGAEPENSAAMSLANSGLPSSACTVTPTGRCLMMDARTPSARRASRSLSFDSARSRCNCAVSFGRDAGEAAAIPLSPSAGESGI
jgi:hypothetical protein